MSRSCDIQLAPQPSRSLRVVPGPRWQVMIELLFSMGIFMVQVRMLFFMTLFGRFENPVTGVSTCAVGFPCIVQQPQNLLRWWCCRCAGEIDWMVGSHWVGVLVPGILISSFSLNFFRWNWNETFVSFGTVNSRWNGVLKSHHQSIFDDSWEVFALFSI